MVSSSRIMAKMASMSRGSSGRSVKRGVIRNGVMIHLAISGPLASSGVMSDLKEPPIKAAVLPVTPYQQNCSLVWCTRTKRAAVIDPGGDLERLKALIAQQGVTLEKVLLTHGHLDHA